MGKGRHTTIKQFFCSNSDQSWNIKKKRKIEILAQVSCIIYKVIELLLSEFSLSFLFHHSHFPPIANSVSHCHFPSCSLFHRSYPSNDPFLPVLLLCFRSFQMPWHWTWDQSLFSGGELAAVGDWKAARGPPLPPARLQEDAEWWCQQRAVRGLGCLFNTWKQPLVTGKRIWRKKVAPPGLN